MTLPLVISPGDSAHISNHEEIHDLLSDATSPFSLALDASGTFAARPAAGVAGRYYLATDTNVLYRDSGAAWVAISSYLTSFAVSLLQASASINSFFIPTARVGKSTVQSLADNTETTITFDLESTSQTWDNDGLHSTASNTSRITASRAGLWLVGANLVFATSVVGQRIARIKHSTNGTVDTEDRDASAGSDFLNISTLVRMAAAEYVTLTGQQSSGGPLNVSTSSIFWAMFLSSE